MAESNSRRSSSESTPWLRSQPSSWTRDVVITQSVAIMEYLEDRFPETTSLFPKDLLAKAKVNERFKGVLA